MTDIPSARVADFMQETLEMVNEQTSLIEAAQKMTQHRIGCLVVHDKESEAHDHQITGLVSETDLVRRGMSHDSTEKGWTVRQIMASPLQTIESHRSMLDVSHVMERQGVRHLCVTDGDEIVGMISIRDLVRHFVYAESGPIRDLDDVYRPLSVLMQTAIEQIAGEETVATAAAHMANKHIGALLVTENGEWAGIVTERDLIQKVIAEELDPQQIKTRTIMNKPIIGIDINRTVHDASDLMAEKWIRHLPVTENGKIVGILSVRDLIRMVALRDRPRFLRQR
ncbi:MAG: CBS domain-containing protein [Nitrospirales bacterium]|nr:CBS domain-containing protein [Nitrospira sp.]MDR4502877.1 CBS domain-containing protein [Nitrospirales bacterium]